MSVGQCLRKHVCHNYPAAVSADGRSLAVLKKYIPLLLEGITNLNLLGNTATLLKARNVSHMFGGGMRLLGSYVFAAVGNKLFVFAIK